MLGSGRHFSKPSLVATELGKTQGGPQEMWTQASQGFVQTHKLGGELTFEWPALREDTGSGSLRTLLRKPERTSYKAEENDSVFSNPNAKFDGAK